MAKKRGRMINIKIHLTNRWLYTLILIGILISLGMVVYAFVNPETGVGHDLADIGLPTCSEGQALGMVTGVWTCVEKIDDVVCSEGQALGMVEGNWGCITNVVNTDYCSGGTCSGTLRVTSTLEVDGRIKLNNIQQFIGRQNCQYYLGTPNSEWCLWSSQIERQSDWDSQAPGGANYMCCRYNVGGYSCGSSIHDACNYYFVGTQYLGARDSLVIPPY